LTGLPGILSTIATVAGEAAALKLARDLGGQKLKLSADPNGKLATIVGAAAAEAIVREWAPGYELIVPMANLRGAGRRRAQVAQMIEGGMSISQAANAGDMHMRSAKRIKASLKNQAPLPLFED
jgi:hypothetical protein